MAAKFQEKLEGDLFGSTQSADKYIKRKTQHLLPPIKNTIAISYENIIFIIIGILMACIISFSLGVEKGKHDAGPQRVQKKASEIYAVRLAICKKGESAENELTKLKKYGYNAYIGRYGGEYRVYAGTFDTKQKAIDAYDELKDQYKNCQIVSITK